MIGFAVDRHDVGHGRLHPAGQFVTGDAGRQVAVTGITRQMPRVEPTEQIGRAAVVGGGKCVGAVQVGRRGGGGEVRGLESGRQETAAEIVLAAAGQPAGVVDGDESRKVFGFAAQRVGHPRTERRKALHRKTRVEKVLALGVRTGLGRQRMDETQVVDQTAQVRQQVRRHFARSTPRPKFPERFGDRPGRPLERHRRHARRGLTVQPVQGRFVIERIDVRDRAGAIDHQHLLGGDVEVGRPRGVGVGVVDVGSDRRHVADRLRCRRQQPVVRQQRRECGGTGGHPGGGQESASVQQRPAPG